MRSHGLRYAIVRILFDLGVAPEDIMAITGHADITTLMKYGKARNRERAAARAMAASTANAAANKPGPRICKITPHGFTTARN